MTDILTARSADALPPPLLTPSIRAQLLAGHRATLRRIHALQDRLTLSDPAGHARLCNEAARIRADIAELEEM